MQKSNEHKNKDKGKAASTSTNADDRKLKTVKRRKIIPPQQLLLPDTEVKYFLLPFDQNALQRVEKCTKVWEYLTNIMKYPKDQSKKDPNTLRHYISIFDWSGEEVKSTQLTALW